MLRDNLTGQSKVSWVAHSQPMPPPLSDIQVQTPDSQVGTGLSGAAQRGWSDRALQNSSSNLAKVCGDFCYQRKTYICTEWPSPVTLHTCLPGAWGRELTHKGCVPSSHCGAMACPVCLESGKLCRQTEGLRAFAHPSPCSRGFRAEAINGAGSKHGERDCLNAWSLNRCRFLGSYVLHFPGEQHADKQRACQFWETKRSETVSFWVAQPLLWFGNKKKKKKCRNFLLLTAKWWTSHLGREVYWEHLNTWRKCGAWEPGFSQRWEMLHIQKIRTICRYGDWKVSASWQPLKVTLLGLFCSPSLPDLICPSVVCLWCCLMTTQSPSNLRSLVEAARVRSSPAPVKCKKSMRWDYKAESQQPLEMEQVYGWEQSCLLALTEAWKYKTPSRPSKQGNLKCSTEETTDHIINDSWSQMIAEVVSMLEWYQRNCKIQSFLYLHFPWYCLPEISLRVISTFSKLSGPVEDLSCHSWKLCSAPKMWHSKSHALLQVQMSKYTHSCGDLPGLLGRCLREVFFL